MCPAVAMGVCKAEKKLLRAPAQLGIEVLLGGLGEFSNPIPYNPYSNPSYPYH